MDQNTSLQEISKKKKNFTPWEVLTFEIFSNTQF